MIAQTAEKKWKAGEEYPYPFEPAITQTSLTSKVTGKLIGCVQHDCEKCKSRDGEVAELKAEWNLLVNQRDEQSAEIFELKRKLEMAEAIIAGDGALITGLKNDVAELSSKNEALSQLYGEQNCLVTELRRLNQVALEAMKYHTEQTRPIERTNDAIKQLEAAK